MSIVFDASDFEVLGRVLDQAAASDLVGKVEPVINHAAYRMKEGMRFDMLSSRSFNPVADDINYDIERFTEHVRAEIGPLSAGPRVGDLAHIAYFGGSRGGGGTVRDPEYWLESETPAIEKHVGDILEDLL